MKKIISYVLAFVFLFSACLLPVSAHAEQADRKIIVAQRGDIVSIDPHLQNDTLSANLCRNVWETLVKLNNETMEFENWLADSIEYEDDVTVKVTLRDEVYFSNGAKLSSEDVKFSLERQKSSGKVGHLVAMIEEIEIVDPLTLILHLNEPSSALISALSHMGSSIMCKKVVEVLDEEGDMMDSPENVIGTGPFKFVSWTPGSGFELEKNNNYWNEEHEAQCPGLLFKVIPEETSRIVALETGEIDVLIDVPSTAIEDIRENDKLKLEEFSSTQLAGIAFNVTKAPFDNKDLREAVAHCIDRDAIIQVVFNGNADLNHACIGVAALGYTDDVKQYDYDLDKAKEKLEEAGHPEGFSFTVLVRTESQSKAMQVVQAACLQAGIEMKIQQVEDSLFADQLGKGAHEAVYAGWSANAEPDNTYRPLFSKDTVAAGGYNFACFWSPEIEDLLAKGSTTKDNEEKLEAYQEIAKIVADECAMIGMCSPKGFVAMQENIEGFDTSSISMYNYDQLHVVEEEK